MIEDPPKKGLDMAAIYEDVKVSDETKCLLTLRLMCICDLLIQLYISIIVYEWLGSI